MSDFQFNIPAGETKRFKTGGKYCPADILVTAEGSAAGDLSDPEYYYQATRPADWLPLPEPGDNEMYFLGHLMEGVDNQFLIKISFGGTCTAEFGNLVDGAFTARETVPLESGVMFRHGINYEDYADETSDGCRQYIVRISGDAIREVRGGEKVADTPATIVDFVCGVPLIFWSANNANSYECINKTFANTRYIRFVGNGSPGDFSCGFVYCVALEALVCQKKSNSQYSTYTFVNCKNLKTISENILTTDTVTTSAMFQGSGIRELPKTPLRVINSPWMFSNSALEFFDGSYVDTSIVTNMTEMFNNCYGLRKVERINISALTTCTSMFNGCRYLQKLTFAGETTPGGITMNLTHTNMSHKALVNMLGSLPTAISPATITITGNPGAAALTDEEIAVATAKNWTVTI